MSDPRVIGEYRLLQKLGGGGFGTVHLAEHLHERSQVALKILQVPLTKSQDFRDFLNETRTMIRLRHPHIIPLLDVGLSSEDFPFLVMEYALEGTLRDRHSKGSQVPLSTIAEYVEQIASALQYAHNRRIIHRDIKPENMLLRTDGTLLLSDFGIAKIMEQTASTSMQKLIGTPAYMAPEQYKGYPCFASDQYALAVVVYEWISGTRPFQGTSIGLAFQHMNVPPPSLLQLVPNLPPYIEQVIFKALSKAPEQRFATIQGFATAFHTAIQEATISQANTQKLTIDTPLQRPNLTPPVQPHNIYSPDYPPQSRTSTQSPTISPSKAGKASRKLSPFRRNILLISGVLLVTILILTLFMSTMSINIQSIGRTLIAHPTPTVPVLNASTASHLVKMWAFQTGDHVDSSPTVVGGVVYAGSYDNNVYAIDALSGHKKWTFPMGSRAYSSPVAADGMVFVSSYDNNVYAIDTMSGHKKWAFPTGDNVASSPTVIDRVVYVGTHDGYLHAIDAQSGKQKWAFQAGYEVYSSPAVVDGVVYVDSSANVYAIDALSGKQKWASLKGASGPLESSPVVAGGVVYFGSDDSNMYAIDALSGERKWAFLTGSYVASSPTVVDGMVYVGSWDGNIYAIDAQSGKQKWAFPTGSEVHSSPVVISGAVYVNSDNKNVYAIDAQSGKQKWAFLTGGMVTSSPVVVNGMVYVGSWDGNIYAIDAQSGKQKWAFLTGGAIHSSPVVVNGVVYVSSDDSNVYAFSSPTTTY